MGKIWTGMGFIWYSMYVNFRGTKKLNQDHQQGNYDHQITITTEIISIDSILRISGIISLNELLYKVHNPL